MKKVKISLLAVTAIVLGICSSAFTTASTASKSVLADEWFLYDGSGPVTDPANYSYSGAIPPCSAHTRYCAFKGQRQAAPNQNLPTQASINSAAGASSNFTIEVANLVVFKP